MSTVYTPKELSWLGVGKETTWGTAATPTYFIPFEDVKPNDNITTVDDQGVRGVMATTFNTLQSIAQGEMEVSGDVFPDSIGLYLLAMLGSDNVTGTTTKTHAFKLGTTQPPSLTMAFYDGTSMRNYAGQIISDLEFTWAKNAALKYDVKGVGKKSATATAATPSITTTVPLMGWNFGLTIGGTADLNLSGFKLSFKRKVTPVQTANNSQDMQACYAGGLEVTGSMTFEKADDTELSAFLNGTKQAIVLTGTQATTSYGITFTITNGIFTKAPVSLKDLVEIDVDFNGIYNTTDGGPAAVTLINAVTSY